MILLRLNFISINSGHEAHELHDQIFDWIKFFILILIFTRNILKEFFADLKIFQNENERLEKFRVKLKEKSKFRLMINFAPKYVGIHHDAMIIDFEVEGQIFKREVSFWR